jgi:GNAT superfamily N-acetyltransferase
MDPMIISLADRPDILSRPDYFADAWPEFMYHDAVSSLFYDYVVTAHPEHCLVAVEPDGPVARAFSFPFHWPADPATALPAGHDAVIVQAVADRLAGRSGTLVAAVEVTVRADRRGTGLSARMLDALRQRTARLGYRDLVVPVRPSGKPEHPDVPLARYVGWTRPDGLPVDPWLRVHLRAGGRVVGLAPRSTTITGTLAEWRSWTGLPFDTAGPVRVPGALVPVHCDLRHGFGVYVEPNVWVHHRV